MEVWLPNDHIGDDIRFCHGLKKEGGFSEALEQLKNCKLLVMNLLYLHRINFSTSRFP